MSTFDYFDECAVRAAPPEVFATVSDLAEMGSWSPENTGGRWLDGHSGPALGARFEGTNERDGDQWSTIATVTAYEPPHVFAFHITYEHYDFSDWEFRITPTDNGCVVRESWSDVRPTFMREEDAVEGFDRAAFTITSIRTTLERLRDACEQ